MENELNLQAFSIKAYVLNCCFHHMMDYLRQNTDSHRDMSPWPISDPCLQLNSWPLIPIQGH